jgi:hypothetical protein
MKKIIQLFMGRRLASVYYQETVSIVLAIVIGMLIYSMVQYGSWWLSVLQSATTLYVLFAATLATVVGLTVKIYYTTIIIKYTPKN